MLRVTHRRLLAAVAAGIVAALASTAFAFTAANTVPNSRAGSGSSTVSGYTVSAVAYGLNATTPTNIDSVSFTINPVAASTVKAKLAGNWYSCTNAAGSVTCTTTAPQLTVVSVTDLEVLAVG